MTDAFMPALRPDLFGQLAATDPYQGRARRLFERGQVVAVEGNQADVRVGYDARGNALELEQVPIISGYAPSVGDWVAIHYEAGHSGAPWVTGPSMAADDASDAPGIRVFPVRDSAPTDPQRSAIYFDQPLETWRGWDGAQWVDFSGKLHNTLPDLQGGAAGEYYHLTEEEYAAIGGGAFPPTAVIYADANGKLVGDASKLSWTATGLGVLCTPEYPLDVQGDVRAWRDGGTRNLRVSVHSDTPNHSAQQHFFRSRGTEAIPTALLSGDTVGYAAVMNGYDGSAYYGGFQFFVTTTEDWDGSHRGVRARFYETKTGEASISEFMRWENAQVRLQSGDAVAPSLAGMSYPDQGLFWPGNTMLAVGLDGAERWRWSGNDIGMVPTGKLYLDGVACSGDTYLRERTANIFCVTAGGYDQFEVWNNRAYLRPNAQDPAGDGQFNMETDHNAFKHQLGSVVHRNGLCIYSGSYLSDSTWSASERTLDSFTIPAAYWKASKRIQVRATVLASASTGATGSVIIRVKIGSTIVMEKSMAAASGLGRAGHFDFDMDFIVGEVAASGDTLYPTRIIRSFTSTDGGAFGNIQNVAAHEMYPMRPVGPALQIDTTAAQAISVVYLNSGSGSVTVLLQGLTVYST